MLFIGRDHFSLNDDHLIDFFHLIEDKIETTSDLKSSDKDFC